MNYERFDHFTVASSGSASSSIDKQIFLVDMKRERQPYISVLVRKAIVRAIERDQRVVIILNKKGYASGVMCQSCGHIPQCDHCDVSIAYHQIDTHQFVGMCHICKTQYRAYDSCPSCSSQQMRPYGIGIQQAKEIVERDLGARVRSIDGDITRSRKKLTSHMSKVAQAQVLVGTELLTTPLSGHSVDLLVYLDADQGLHIPDFGAPARNFWFLYDGLRSYECPHMIVQSYNPEHPSIRAACALDVKGFLRKDRAFRSEHMYPPCGTLCVLRYKHEIQERVHTQVDTVYKELLFLQQKYDMHDIQIYTTPPLVYKIYGKYRYHIILKGKNLRNFMDIAYSALNLHRKHFIIDWNAQTLVS